jgi:hypothetical protein
LNGDNIFEFVNEAFAGLCGVSKNDIIRNPLIKVFFKLGVNNTDLNRFEKMMIDKKKKLAMLFPRSYIAFSIV